MHRQAPASATDWMRLIQAEYLEMPGLHLTKPQVKRLWGLDEQTCDSLLNALVNAQFLTRNQRQAYVLAGATRY